MLQLGCCVTVSKVMKVPVQMEKWCVRACEAHLSPVNMFAVLAILAVLAQMYDVA